MAYSFCPWHQQFLDYARQCASDHTDVLRRGHTKSIFQFQPAMRASQQFSQMTAPMDNQERTLEKKVRKFCFIIQSQTAQFDNK